MVAGSRKIFWTGWVLSILSCLLFIFSAALKLSGGPEVLKGFSHLGIPSRMMIPLAILEIACVVVYLIPATSVVGAILLTGFLGGAICTHWRVGDPFYIHIALGILIWLGIYIREERLRALIPLRQRTESSA